MAFKLKSGNRPVFKQMGSSPLNYNSPLKQDKDGKGKIIYKDGKKYYKASDGTLHTGQVSDYEAELAEDRAGVGSGHNRKVMKDGYVNPTQKKKLADRKAAYDKLSDAEKKKLQDAANKKAEAWRNSKEYKDRRKKADAKTKKANKKKIDTTQIDLLKKNNRYTKAN
jgi:hypothetical protein